MAPIFRVEEQSMLATCFMIDSCLAYSAILKIVATYSSETSVDFKRTIRRYILKDRILHDLRSENLKSYINISVVLQNPHKIFL
jgi:hypothetical protein